MTLELREKRGGSGVPLWIYLTFYVITSMLGALLITNATVFEIWSLMFPTMDARWLAPGATATYWLLVVGPIVFVPLLAGPASNVCRAPAAILARRLHMRASPTAVCLVASAMLGYCIFNLGRHGFLGVDLFDARTYQENIVLRTRMFGALGELHFAIIYVGIPSLAIVALYSAVRERSRLWWTLFGFLSASLGWLYLTTLTKSNVLIFGVAITAAAYQMGLVRRKGLITIGVAGLAILTVLDFLLSGSDPFALVRTFLNVVFRVSSGIPFYLAIFPEQVQYVGLDVGLSRFGIGPEIPANQVVANYMFPGDTWVQSAAPAPAHLMAYAQGGVMWSLATIVMIGFLVGFASALSRVARSPLAYSAFIGTCMACYYASQTDFMGTFQHSYGYLWWLTALGAVMVVQWLLQKALGPNSEERKARASTP